MNFLYAAYAAAWLILIVYLGNLAMRYERLRKELKDLNGKN
jgi:CcmD family protein